VHDDIANRRRDAEPQDTGRRERPASFLEREGAAAELKALLTGP
jgi:hypothetical protein